MGADTLAVIALGTAGILSAIPLLHLLEAALGGDPLTGSWGPLMIAAAAGLLTGAAGGLAIGLPGDFLAQSAALGALFCAIATVPARAAGAGPLAVALSSVAACALVYVPACTFVFFVWFDPFGTHLGVVDFGIALPVFVGACSVALATIVPELRRTRESGRRAPRGRAAVLAFVGLWIAVMGWMLGMELDLDSLSLPIIANVIIMPIASALTGAIVERVRHVANTGQGFAGAGLAGLAAAVPSCAYLEPVLALAIGLIAGAVCALLPRGGYFVGSRLVVRTLLVGAALGLVLLGIFARGAGTFSTGQPELLFGQVLGCLLVVILGYGVGALLWLLRGRDRRRPA